MIKFGVGGLVLGALVVPVILGIADDIKSSKLNVNNDGAVQTFDGKVSFNRLEGISREEAARLDSALVFLYSDSLTRLDLSGERPLLGNTYSLYSRSGKVQQDSLPFYLERMVEKAGLRVDCSESFNDRNLTLFGI
ncbi:MAG: hypothetical protein KKB31_01270 [Nanoarchaeota archaeon]|nr:hypothetical protein [Nanoarchaeota archaeon]